MATDGSNKVPVAQLRGGRQVCAQPTLFFPSRCFSRGPTAAPRTASGDASGDSCVLPSTSDEGRKVGGWASSRTGVVPNPPPLPRVVVHSFKSCKFNHTTASRITP